MISLTEEECQHYFEHTDLYAKSPDGRMIRIEGPVFLCAHCGQVEFGMGREEYAQ